MAKCQEANNVIRRRAILDIASFSEQNMHLKPMTAILNTFRQKLIVSIQRLKYRAKNAVAKPQRNLIDFYII